MTFVWSMISALIVLISTMQTIVLAFGVTGVISSSRAAYQYHYPTFAYAQHGQSLTRKNTLQLAASKEDDDNGDFFSDDSNSNGGRSFFEEVEKQPQSTKTVEKEDNEEPMALEELEMLATPFDEHLPKINTVTLVGRVGNNPEPRYFDDGKVVLNLSLAVKRKYNSLERKVRNIRSGEEETDWFPLEFWGRDAEYVTNYVEKGSRLGITGSLTQDAWIDKTTGEQRRKPKIIVRHTDILESRAEAELRKGNKGSYDGGNSGGGSGRGSRSDGDDDEGLSPAGTGGFFS